jgi:hypothetical protein
VASKLLPGNSRQSRRSNEATVLRRLKYYDWTFSNTIETATGLMLALLVVAVVLG